MNPLLDMLNRMTRSELAGVLRNLSRDELLRLRSQAMAAAGMTGMGGLGSFDFSNLIGAITGIVGAVVPGASFLTPLINSAFGPRPTPNVAPPSQAPVYGPPNPAQPAAPGNNSALIIGGIALAALVLLSGRKR